MNYDVPLEFEPHIQEIASTQHISANEALGRIIKAGIDRLVPSTDQPRFSYASLFGAAKSGYGSREAVDRALAEMRNEW